jgi:UDP-glucose 4-epimerase
MEVDRRSADDARDTQVVLVTGVAGYWGKRLARRLLQEPALHTIGIDNDPPEAELAGLDFIQADVRNPLLAELLRAEIVGTVCHLAFADEGKRRSEALFDYNVMGTMKVIGACAEAGVSKVVLKSSTQVYGAHPDNDAFLAEDSPLRGSRRAGSIRYRLEIEAFCNGFRRQAPQLALTVLRFANVVGPTAGSAMNRYLRGPLAPMLLGFDPMMQVIHEDDVVDALAFAVANDTPEVCNVAADPPLPLLRILGLAGRLPLPVLHPVAYRVFNRLGVPFAADYLRYRWVADLSRMHDAMDFYPQLTGDAAVEALGAQVRMNKYQPGAQDMAYDEERLRKTLERRRDGRSETEGSNIEEVEDG